MKKLIEIQAVINKIEDLTDLKYKTEFDYVNDKNLIIKCFYKDHAMMLMMMLSNTPDTVWYFKSNTEIEIIDLTKE